MSDRPDTGLPEEPPAPEPEPDPQPPQPEEPPPAPEAAGTVQVVARHAIRLQTHTEAFLAQGGGVPTTVPTAFWREWLETHQDSQMVKSHAIFAHE